VPKIIIKNFIFTKKIILILLAIFLVFSASGALTYLFLSNGKDIIREVPPKGMTFEVTVPRNTPEGDTVHIYLHNQNHYKMDKVGDYKYSISLSEDKLQPTEGKVKYRYSRNGYDFRTAEYLEPDTDDYFWTEKGRSTVYKQAFTQRDVVKRWRWFPEDSTPNVRTTTLEPQDDFLKRVGGQEFMSGQIIEDLYNEVFRDFFDSTAKHMKNIGYKLAEIDPPQQLVEENGLPRVRNLIDKNPNYPDDMTLKEEILAYKKQGLKVMLAPQLCCETLNTKNRNKKWWDAYFAEVTKFLAHYAKIAESTGVDYFHYAVGVDYQEKDYTQRWSSVFKEVRKYYKGRVGEMVWNLGSEPAIIPDAKYISWGNELDYFYVAIDHPISSKDSPTDDELKQGAAKMLDGVKELYDRYKKPVFVRTTYFNVKNTWKGNSFYSISSVPWVSEPESKIKATKYEWNTEDLARVVNAYFEAISEKPWIFGYAQFGYTHWENPLATEISVRGKPAEDIWRKWNNTIFKTKL